MRQCFRLKFILLFLWLPHSSALFAQKEYLDEVFGIIEANSLNRDTIDFKSIRRRAYDKLDNVKSTEECYPIIRFILSELNDHHSFFMDRDAVSKWKSTSKSDVDKNLPPPFEGKTLHNNIGYITMRGFSSGDSIAIKGYATALQNLIKGIDRGDINGWVLDLRENGGGNCWPMLTGLGPLLGEGVCGYFIDNKDNKLAWFYKNGAAGLDSVVKVSVYPYKLKHDGNPIAVLTGPLTGSSGEVVVTAFRGKRNSKSFGESTAGVSTGNGVFDLSDGSMILLTTSVYADRCGNKYGKKIPPDFPASFEYGDLHSGNDLVIEKAIDWIKNYNKTKKKTKHEEMPCL